MQQHPSTHYIGPKGYSVPKSSLTAAQLHEIKTKLSITPRIPGSPVARDPFPVFRESAQKIYMPKMFGMDYFHNLAPKFTVGEGDAISVPFVGTLRPGQIPYVESYLALPDGQRNGLIVVGCGGGKTVK